jgi:hypothetical protein
MTRRYAPPGPDIAECHYFVTWEFERVSSGPLRSVTQALCRLMAGGAAQQLRMHPQCRDHTTDEFPPGVQRKPPHIHMCEGFFHAHAFTLPGEGAVGDEPNPRMAR